MTSTDDRAQHNTDTPPDTTPTTDVDEAFRIVRDLMHDLSNPLTVVTTHIAALRRRQPFTAEDLPYLNASVERLDRGTERMIALFLEASDRARVMPAIAAGHEPTLSLTLEPHRLSDIIATGTRWANSAHSSEPVQAASTPSPIVRADGPRLARLIERLVVAMKDRGDPGRPSISIATHDEGIEVTVEGALTAATDSILTDPVVLAVLDAHRATLMRHDTPPRVVLCLPTAEAE